LDYFSRIVLKTSVQTNAKTIKLKIPNKNPKLITTRPTFILVLALVWAGLSRQATAVTPAPDGGYAGGNTAEGTNALFSLSSGTNNTAIGLNALYHNTTASLNVAVGAQALVSNIGGLANTALGTQALYRNSSATYNTAIGYQALYKNSTGQYNTATGVEALVNNNGSYNTATGVNALFGITTGSRNTAVGYGALTSGGSGAGASNNTAIGYQSMLNGFGSSNIALGFQAGYNTAGNYNIDIGNTGVAGESSTIRIGGGFQHRTFIAGIRGRTTTNANAVPVVIDSAGQLGTVSSSERFKHDIAPMDKASEAVLALRPVTFHYKRDSKDTPQFGLIAEEVAKINPDLVVRDDDGEIYTVRYDAVNTMLLNEFLKAHRKIEAQDRHAQEQDAHIAEQQKQIETLTTALRDQAQQIQKIGAAVQVEKAGPQLAGNLK
jgi:hypothetical protein